MKYYWNDKEVSEEEYQLLNAQWKERVREMENSKSSDEPTEKKSRKRK